MIKILKGVKLKLDLPLSFGISCTFNVEDLVPYIEVILIPLLIHSSLILPRTFFLRAPLPPLPLKLPYAAENIDFILDDQIVSTGDGGTQHYLVKWKGRFESENSWIIEDFRWLDPGQLEHYHSQQQLPLHTRQGRVYPTFGEMMRASRHWDDCLIESILDSGNNPLHFFGFSYFLILIYLL